MITIQSLYEAKDDDNEKFDVCTLKKNKNSEKTISTNIKMIITFCIDHIENKK